MFSWLGLGVGGRKIICPYCLAEIRGKKHPEVCPSCKMDLPVQYVHDYEIVPPFFVQVFGRPGVGKTVFLSALTLVMRKMANVWQGYNYAPATAPTLEMVENVAKYEATGLMPNPTTLGVQEIYVMLLKNMSRWGGRTLVTRDCPGEIFTDLEVPVEQAPFLLNAPTTFMFISLYDLQKDSQGHSIDLLMTTYITTLMKHKINFKKERRKVVVVLSKGDIIPGLPPNLRNYLEQDPFWQAINSRSQDKFMDASTMQEYIETMHRVSDAIRNWVNETAAGKTFIQLAKERNIDLRFSIISATGSNPKNGQMVEQLMPRRVLDPYFWALELQSQ